MTKFAGVAGVAGVYLPAYAGRETVKKIGSVFLTHFYRTASRNPPPRPPQPPQVDTKEQVISKIRSSTTAAPRRGKLLRHRPRREGSDAGGSDTSRALLRCGHERPRGACDPCKNELATFQAMMAACATGIYAGGSIISGP